MAHEQFVEHRFHGTSLELVQRCDQIITNYMSQGLRLTLRQLYYQLVQANVVVNEEKSYKRLGSIVSDARLAGLLDWDGIEDRVRQPWIPGEWDSPDELIEAALHGFKLPRREGQETYVELWVEKDALAGVLSPIAREFHCALSVNRGYSSQSAMYEAAQRFINADAESKTIVYIGDFDPSGEDMVRDIGDRLDMFGVSVYVDKVALTMEQIKRFNPPPNPAKLTDSRAAGFIAKHGRHSWEVDSLPPKELQKIARSALKANTDMDKMQKVIDRENKMRNDTAKKLGITL